MYKKIMNLLNKQFLKLKFKKLLFACFGILIIAITTFTYSSKTDLITFKNRDSDVKLVSVEYDIYKDTVYEINPNNLTDKKIIADFQHVANWSLNPADKIFNSFFIFTLPSVNQSDKNPRTNSQISALNLKTKQTITIGNDADLMISPIINIEKNQIIYRSTSEENTERIITYDLYKRIKTIVFESKKELGMIPIYAKNEEILTVIFNKNGSQLMLIKNNIMTNITTLSKNFTKDWQLSPDGSMMSYIEQEISNEKVNYNLKIYTFADNKIVKLNIQNNNLNLLNIDALTIGQSINNKEGIQIHNYLSPIWLADSEEIVFGIEKNNYLNQNEIQIYNIKNKKNIQINKSPKGINLPISVNKDNTQFLLKNFKEDKAVNVILESIYIYNVNLDDNKKLITEKPIIFIGWWNKNEK